MAGKGLEKRDLVMGAKSRETARRADAAGGIGRRIAAGLMEMLGVAESDLVPGAYADLLLVECATPDELAVDGHMSPARVGALCRDASPRRVVLAVSCCIMALAVLRGAKNAYHGAFADVPHGV